jgi:type IV pilus assembly protein PilM
MPVSKGVWGIDIGQCALKAVRLEMIDGKPTATAFDIVEHTKILSQPDADPDVLIREALEKFLSRNEIKNDEVAIGIAGQSGLARFVKLPPVEEKKIGDIVKFEAKQQIPFPLEEVVWAYQKIAGGDVTDGFAMETEIGLFAMKRDVISRYLGYFNSSKIEVHTVQMSPLALVNFATYEVLKKGGTTPVPPEEAEAPADDVPRGKKRCVVVLDIGTEASNLIITDGGKVIWQRPIPLGGNNFTRALTKELKLTFAKAEHLKRNAAKSPELPQILKALKPVLTDFVGEVQRSLGYFTNTHRDAHVAYMVGLGSAFRLPGLQKYLSEKLTLEVKKPDRFGRLSGEAVLTDPLFKENMLTFPVAYGLALQGLGEARLSTNLLPPEIRTDRLVRAKKPFATAAAALLLIGVGILAAAYSGPYAAAHNKQAEEADKKAKAAGSAADAQNAAIAAEQGKAKLTQEQAEALMAGHKERLNHPRFQEVLSAALPRSGKNGNIPPDFEGMTTEVEVPGGKVMVRGADANRWFENRLRNGLARDLKTGNLANPSGDENSPNLRLLAMVNVEVVYSRWVHNLPGFLQAADERVKRDFNNNIAEWMKPDEQEEDGDRKRKKPKIAESPNGGWVYEIRGYTYHKDGEQFIKKTLIANLQRFDDFARERDPDKVTKYTFGVDKSGKPIPGLEDPLREKDPADPEGKKYRSRVSHSFIYAVWPYYDPEPGVFRFINQSYLDPLVGGGTGGGISGPGMPGPRPGAAMPGPMGPMGGEGGGGATATAVGPSWVPLTGSTSSSSPIGPGAGPGPGGPRGSAVVAGPMLPMPGPGPMGTPGPGATPVSAAGKPGDRQRFEFVVMFVWREDVKKLGEDAAPPAGGGGGYGPSPGAPQTGGRGEG